MSITKCIRYHKKPDCERCGNTGYRKKCYLNECAEYGCCGDGNCIPTKEEIEAWESMQK